MPKPLKKKRARPQDVNQWARQLVEKSTAEPETAPTIPPAALTAYMSALGRKGGQVSGKRRMKNLSSEQRQEIALKAARARWAKRRQ
jgi:hypothetical protein